MDSQKAIDHIISRMRTGLPASLKYHSVDHTLYVMKSARCIAEAENVNSEDLELLMIAAAYHDSGLLESYHRHEVVSSRIAGEVLPGFGHTPEQVKLVQGMIMATQIPQTPTNHLERILADADLHYLGGDDYETISNRLLEEMRLQGNHMDEATWLELQIDFLKKHNFWTSYSIQRQTQKKEATLARLMAERESLQH